MLRLLMLSGFRFYWRQPWQLGIAIAGVTLGVAAFVGIQSANSAAARSFELSTGAFGIGVTHRVIPAGRELPVDVYERLVLAGYGNDAAPVAAARVEVTTTTGGRRSVELIGVDPIKEARLRRYVPAGGGGGDALVRLLTEAGAVLVPDDGAFSASGAEPESLETWAGGVRRLHPVVGRYLPAGASAGEVEGLVTLLETVHELSASATLSRIDLSIEADEADRIRTLLPPRAALVEASNQNSDLAAMTHAFTTNLTALGLLALVVGLFLIYATMSFAVVRRRPQIAVLRAIGLTRREIAGMIALEAIVIGTVAGAAGGLVGHLLAEGLVDLVLRTMDDLAFSRAVAARTGSHWIVPGGIAIGIAATLVAALLPAIEAARVPPATAERRSDLEVRTRRGSVMLGLSSIPVLLASAIVLAASPGNLALGFLGLFLVLIAGALVVPLATVGLMRLLEKPARLTLGLPAVMAVRAVTASLSRTGVATAALAIAVATVISIGLMIGSFRTSLIAWIEETLTADIYVLLDAETSDPDVVAQWADAIDAMPDVAGISVNRRATVPGPSGPLELRAATRGPEGWGLDVVEASDLDWSERLAAGDGVVVAEPYAYRHRLAVGVPLHLRTPDGERAFEILAIARDYNTAGAGAVMDLGAYRQIWDDPAVSGIGVHVLPDADVDGVAAAIGAARPSGVDAVLRSTGSIREISLMLFDRTFEITSVLRALAGIVAFFGVLSAVLALELERAGELLVLRAVGMSLGQLRLNVVLQTALLGLAAAVAALPIGAVLAWLLVFVINKRAFGWSMDFELAVAPLAVGVGVALTAATLSGLAAAVIDSRRRAVRDSATA